jgi:hypothetical protein
MRRQTTGWHRESLRWSRYPGPSDVTPLSVFRDNLSLRKIGLVHQKFQTGRGRDSPRSGLSPRDAAQRIEDKRPRSRAGLNAVSQAESGVFFLSLP